MAQTTDHKDEVYLTVPTLAKLKTSVIRSIFKTPYGLLQNLSRYLLHNSAIEDLVCKLDMTAKSQLKWRQPLDCCCGN